MKNQIKLMPIDFTQSWLRIIINQKKLLFFVIFLVMVRYTFAALEPFFIALILEHKSWYFFGGMSLLWVLYEFNNIILQSFNSCFQVSIIHSIFYNAHLYLLAIDPHYHVKRSSGSILAKIDRAARGYEDVLDQVTYAFAPLVMGIITMVVILSYYSFILAFGICCCLALMIGYGYYFAQYSCQKWENDFIQTDDDFKSTAFENLAQIHLIRATFSSDYMREKLVHKISVNSKQEQNLWLSYSFVSRILEIIYTLSILLLIAFFIYRMQYNLVPLSHAVGIILSYLQCTHQVIKILQPFRRYMRGMVAIKDLYQFMQHFGKQTMPIFDTQNYAIEKNRNNILEVDDLVFGYGEAKLFDHQRFNLACSSHLNKLYGIIGPSGAGKTTFISILGGQLRPLSGNVLVNGIDIYAVGDVTRRHLITLQGQIATSVKGTVRYNLLFGLPENHGYSDQYLCDVLKRVGLEHVFNEHQGLDTLLGEGALNISGGQRQRLNFVGLYVRARFYKPILILIDEPTSSLDEISELAVTQMISELALHSLTLVIAHRLKTLENAAGLIDLSLLADTKNIQTYTPDELKKCSAYYRSLLENKAEF